MPSFLRARALLDGPLQKGAAAEVIVGPGAVTDLCHFQLVSLAEGGEIEVGVPGFELVAVVLSGQVDVRVGGQVFSGVGRRPDVWSGQADSVYAGQERLTLVGRQPATEVAIAGGRSDQRFAPFRVLPEELEMVEVGSAATHSRRRIFHILGQNANGRAGNLLVSELRADAGCWSGYPPHKHDEERPPEETAFQEVYHYRYRPETGFGAQLWYEPDGEPVAHVTRHRDTFAFERGYHPTVTSPGHEAYVFTIIVGRHQRSLRQWFDPRLSYLQDVIPGLSAMQDKFK